MTAPSRYLAGFTHLQFGQIRGCRPTTVRKTLYVTASGVDGKSRSAVTLDRQVVCRARPARGRARLDAPRRQACTVGADGKKAPPGRMQVRRGIMTEVHANVLVARFNQFERI